MLTIFYPIAVAQTIVHAYTTSVNQVKIKLVLLIALLCYGQIATSIHVAGHFHVDTCEAVSGAGMDTCPSSMPRFTDLVPVALHLGPHHADHAGDHADSHDDDHSALDCAIYHALLNLNGIEAAVPDGFEAPLQQITGPSARVTSVARAAIANQPIRAPPA